MTSKMILYGTRRDRVIFQADELNCGMEQWLPARQAEGRSRGLCLRVHVGMGELREDCPHPATVQAARASSHFSDTPPGSQTWWHDRWTPTISRAKALAEWNGQILWGS